MISDKERFIRILDKHQGILISLCSVYYDTLTDQQDAFQDISLQLWKSFKDFRGEAEVTTWMYRVGLNTLLSKRRTEKRRSINVTTLDKAMELPGNQQWAVDDNYQMLLRLISVLNDKDKAILILYLEGYSHREIAVVLSTSQTNISTRFNRVKALLKGKLQKINNGD